MDEICSQQIRMEACWRHFHQADDEKMDFHRIYSFKIHIFIKCENNLIHICTYKKQTGIELSEHRIFAVYLTFSCQFTFLFKSRMFHGSWVSMGEIFFVNGERTLCQMSDQSFGTRNFFKGRCD